MSNKDKQSIRVTIRVRPISLKQKNQDPRVCINVSEQNHSLETIYNNQIKKFVFDSICNNNSQEDMFQKVGKKSTEYCLEGYNCTIFAYGQTGSGKTFTMMGVDPAHQQYQSLRGLVPRTLEFLFDSIDEQIKETNSQYIIRCSFLQIYNQQIIDLLNKNNGNLQIRQDIKKGVYVEGISQQTIFKGQQALQILKKGSKGRHVGSTYYNETSSRSHSVFTMQIQSKHLKCGIINTKIRYFHFIDLAGSERTKKIEGERLKQGCSINKSLHVLGKVINSLGQSSQGKNKHINYRDSKLTFLLKDSLGGNSKTHLIANVSPCSMSYGQTIMTLNFARRVKLIKVNKVLINEDSSGNLQSLKNEIKRLKQQNILLKSGTNDKRYLINISKQDNFLSSQKISSQMSIDCERILETLNLYIQQELQKQTLFQFEMSKLQQKFYILQQGIRNYSQNQIHLKMIIEIYFDKIFRLENNLILINNKISRFQEQEQNDCQINSYFKKQINQMQRQRQIFRKIMNKSVNLLKLFKMSKTYQKINENKNEKSTITLMDAIQQNTQFLVHLKEIIIQIKYQYSNKDKVRQNGLNKGIISQERQNKYEKKISMITQSYQKRQIEILQKLQKYQLQNQQIKILLEQSQSLLRNSVDKELNLQEQIKSIKQKQIIYLQDKIRKTELENKELSIKLFQLQQTIKILNTKLHSSQNSFLIKNSQFQHILQIKQSQNNQLLKKYIQLQKLFVQKENNFIIQQQKLQLDLEKQRQNNQQLKNKIEKFKQIEKTLNHEITRLKQYLKLQYVKIQNLKQNQQNQNKQLKLTIEELSSNVRKLQRQKISITQHKQLIENKMKQLTSQNNNIIKQKSIIEQEIQKINWKLSQNQKQVENYKANILLLNHKFMQNQKQQLERIQNYKQKQKQYIDLITQMQNNHNINHEQINKIKIENIKLKQQKQLLQSKMKRLNQKYKQLQINLQMKINIINKKDLQIDQKSTKFNIIKQQLGIKKQQILDIIFSHQILKSQNSSTNLNLNQTRQELKIYEKKNQSLRNELFQLKKQFQLFKLQKKQIQNSLYVHQKMYQIQKQKINKQSQRIISKIIDQKQLLINQLKIKQKSVQELKYNISKIHQDNRYLKQLNQNSEQFFKKNLQLNLKKNEERIQKFSIQIQQKKKLLNSKDENLKQFTEKNQLLTLQISNKIQIIKQMEVQISQIKLNQQYFLLQIQKLKDQIFNFEQLKQKYQKQIQNLQIDHNSQLDQKNQEIQQKNQQINRRQNIIQEKEKIINELINNINYLNQSHQKISIKQKQINFKIVILEKQGQNKQKIIQQLKFQTTNYQKQNINLQKQNIQIKKLLIQKDNLNELCSIKLKQTKQQYESKISGILKTNKQQNLNFIKNQLKNQQLLTSQINKLKIEKQNLFQQIQKVSSKSIQLEQQLILLKNQLTKNQQYLIQKQLIYRNKQKQNNNQIQLLISQNQNLDKAIQILNNNLKYTQNILSSKQNQIQQLKDIVQDYQNKIVINKTKELSYQNQMKLLQQNLLKRQIQYKKVENEKNILSSTIIEKLSPRISQLQAEIKSQKQKISIKIKQTLQIIEKQKDKQNLTKIQLKQEIQKLQSIIKQQKIKIQQLQILIRQKQGIISKFILINQQKQEIFQSYKSLQQINKGLGLRCDQLIKSLQDQKTQYRKLQTKFLGEKKINQNLKQLIQNSDQQKKQLNIQLNQKNEIYHKLLQKIAKNDTNLHGNPKQSQHYLKFFDLLQKSRQQNKQLKQQNQELKKNISLKIKQINDITKKSQQYTVNIQNTVKQFQKDHQSLQKKYNEAIKSKQMQQNELQKIRQQYQQVKPKMSRMTLKIQELEERIRLINKQFLDVQNQNHQLKKKILYPGSIDQKTSNYINKLKSEINDFKKQNQILQQKIKRQSSQRVKLKTQIRNIGHNSNDHSFSTNVQNHELKSQLDRKTNQIYFYQKMIAQQIQILKINQYDIGSNPKSIKIQSVKKSILQNIKDLINENQILKNKKINDELNLNQHNSILSNGKQNKIATCFTYNGYGSSGKKQLLNTSSSQKRQKSYTMKQQQLTSIIRNKINQQFASQQKKKSFNIGGLGSNLGSNLGSGITNVATIRQSFEIKNNNDKTQNQESYQCGQNKTMKIKDIIINSNKFKKDYYQ